MGYLYSTGRGVRQDPVAAYLFFQQAAAKGDVLAKDLLVRLRNSMSPAQIRAAEKRAEASLRG
jgi:TPR repeat protein